MLHRLLGTRRAVLGLVLLGLALRSYHYLRGRPIWHDEAVLIFNIQSLGFRDLLGPLRFHEAAPPLFLWLTRAVALALGDGSYALRLAPFLASCSAMLLLAPVARRLLAPRAVPWALLLFACSEQLAWHACEVKPYALEVLAAVVVLAVYTRARQGALTVALLAYTALAPVLIFLCYPAGFLYGGVLAALLPPVWRLRGVRTWLAYGALAAVTGLSFLLLALGPARAQHDAQIQTCWANCMPDWGRPWGVPAWAVLSTLEVCRYGLKPLGQTLAGLAVLGGVVLWRGGRRGWVVLLTLPIGLALLAALLHRYPYGGARVMAYATPAVCLLIAAGTPPALDWLRPRSRPAAAGTALLLLMPLAVAVQRVVILWPEADVPGAAAYVEAHRRPGEPVTGNNWTHLYYFRHLDTPFRPPEDHPAQGHDRLWVVITDDQRPARGRFELARQMAPPGWHALRQADFAFTTVALFAPDIIIPSRSPPGRGGVGPR
jgi:hypothetical protein